MQQAVPPSDQPFVSVIMPVRNEADFVARSLQAVLDQDYPHHLLEVIIADGMSTDQTRAEIMRIAAQHLSIPVRILDNPKQIVPTGMNLAIREAKGEIIVRVDGHCEIAPDYVSQCVQHIQQHRVHVVGGPITTIGNSNLSRAIALGMSSSFGVGGSAFRTVTDRMMFVDTVAFPAFTREAIEAAGPFDEKLVRNQDDEYNYRLRKLGYKILLSPEIKSKYYSRSTLRSLRNQYYQYGYYKARVARKLLRQMRVRHFVPLLFVIAVLIGGVVALLYEPSRLPYLIMLGLYAIANLAFSVRLASGYGWYHLPYLPTVFLTLHFSYGLGFLIGAVLMTLGLHGQRQPA